MQKEIANEIVDFLHLSMPEASIAISGSIAAGTYSPNSDIDLLIVKKTIIGNYSVTFTYKAIKVSIFIFSKDVLFDLRYIFIETFHCMPYNFIMKSTFYYDPLGISAKYKSYINDAIIMKKIRSDEIVNTLKNRLKKYDTEKQDVFKIDIIYNIYRMVIDIFFLRRCTINVTSKDVAHNPLSFIKEEDNELYSLLIQILDSCLENKKRLFYCLRDYILTNY